MTLLVYDPSEQVLNGAKLVHGAMIEEVVQKQENVS